MLQYLALVKKSGSDFMKLYICINDIDNPLVNVMKTKKNVSTKKWKQESIIADNRYRGDFINNEEILDAINSFVRI